MSVETSTSPSRWTRQRAQALINRGLWVEKHESALKTIQGVLGSAFEEWREAETREESLNLAEAAVLSSDDAVDLLMSIVAELRRADFWPEPEKWDGAVRLPDCETPLLAPDPEASAD